MALNKKGIMVKFLVTIMVALFIFIPACMFTSKLFTLSSQARTNFLNFVEEIKDIQNAPHLAKETSILILDKGTAVVYFQPKKEEVKVDVATTCKLCVDYSFTLKKPNNCFNEEDGCICLFREVEYKIDGASFTVNPTTTICEEVSKEIQLPNCGFGVAKDVRSYTCSDGFLIERNLASSAKDDITDLDVVAYFQLGRRVPITMQKYGESIIMCGNPPCTLPGQPAPSTTAIS